MSTGIRAIRDMSHHRRLPLNVIAALTISAAIALTACVSPTPTVTPSFPLPVTPSGKDQIFWSGLSDPQGLILDADGNLVIADPGNHGLVKLMTK